MAAGATLGLGVGTGPTYYGSADVDDLFAGTMPNVSNDPNSNVGIDTTAGNFTYASNIPSTTRGLTKLGTNTLTLTGSNSYTGGTLMNAGIFNVNGDAALGAASAPLSFTGNGTLQAGANFVLNSSRSITANQVAATIDTQGYNMSITGPLGGQGTLTKAGLGNLTLSGPNTYNGQVLVNAGTVTINARPVSGLWEGLVSVNGPYNSTNGSRGYAYDYTDLVGPIPKTSVQPVVRLGGPGPFTSQGNNVYPSWADNTTWGYSGYLDNTSNHSITYTFGKEFDDGTSLIIDGKTVIDDGNASNAITGQIALGPGMHKPDLRFCQGWGDVGPWGTGGNNGGPPYNAFGVAYNTVLNTSTSGTWVQMGASGPNTQFYATNLPGLLFSQVAMSSSTTLDLSPANAWGTTVALASLADASGSTTGHQVLLGNNTLQTGMDNSSTTFSGTISGNGSLMEVRAGMFTLAGVNSYTGSTSVTAGILTLPRRRHCRVTACQARSAWLAVATLVVQPVNGPTGWSSLQIDALVTNANWNNAPGSSASIRQTAVSLTAATSPSRYHWRWPSWDPTP